MAELSVKMEYADAVKKSLRETLKLTIPIWAFIPAVLLIVGLVSSSLALGNQDMARALRSLYMIVFGLGIPLISLLTLKYLSKSSLRLDQSGLDLPADLTAMQLTPLHLSWKEINKITVTEQSDSNDLKDREILLLTKRGSTVIHLNRLDPLDIEKLLVSIDLFYGGEKDDHCLANLARDLKIAQRKQSQAELSIEGSGLTYTELWEDELKRRFKAAAFMPLAPGLIMRGGSLTIVRQLALGGLSAVYLAQLNGNKLVVLKESVVPDDARSELKDKAREMFSREAKLLMQLHHPNIVKVIDNFEEGGRSYLLLDYVSGQDLRQYVKQNGRLREYQVLGPAIQIADILTYLHSKEPPLLHRDLTPDNIVLRADGSVVVIDFGAANEFIGNATGTFVGKQAFIAPEQFRGKAVAKSDIYAFGATLYYLLTGQDPEALSQSEPSAVCQIKEDLSDLVKRCTSLEPDERPEAREVSQVLKELLAGYDNADKHSVQ